MLSITKMNSLDDLKRVPKKKRSERALCKKIKIMACIKREKVERAGGRTEKGKKKIFLQCVYHATFYMYFSEGSIMYAFLPPPFYLSSNILCIMFHICLFCKS